MTPELLAEIGALLYGRQWIFPLARDLGDGYNVRTVERWAAGQRPIPDDVKDELRELFEERLGQLWATPTNTFGRVIEAMDALGIVR